LGPPSSTGFFFPFRRPCKASPLLFVRRRVLPPPSPPVTMPVSFGKGDLRTSLCFPLGGPFFLPPLFHGGFFGSLSPFRPTWSVQAPPLNVILLAKFHFVSRCPPFALFSAQWTSSKLVFLLRRYLIAPFPPPPFFSSFAPTPWRPSAPLGGLLGRQNSLLIGAPCSLHYWCERLFPLVFFPPFWKQEIFLFFGNGFLPAVFFSPTLVSPFWFSSPQGFSEKVPPLSPIERPLDRFSELLVLDLRVGMIVCRKALPSLFCLVPAEGLWDLLPFVGFPSRNSLLFSFPPLFFFPDFFFLLNISPIRRSRPPIPFPQRRPCCVYMI